LARKTRLTRNTRKARLTRHEAHKTDGTDEKDKTDETDEHDKTDETDETNGTYEKDKTTDETDKMDEQTMDGSRKDNDVKGGPQAVEHIIQHSTQTCPRKRPRRSWSCLMMDTPTQMETQPDRRRTKHLRRALPSRSRSMRDWMSRWWTSRR
jgi:hypothetical protein